MGFCRATLGESLHCESLDDTVLNISLPYMEDDETVEDLDNSLNSAEALITSEKYIVFKQSLIDLVHLTAGKTCKYAACNNELVFSFKTFGCAVLMTWTCVSGHNGGRWSSQPKFKNMFSGNLQLATDILLTGNSYRKIALMFSFFNMAFVSEDTFYRIQKLYALPAIEKYWHMQQVQLLAELGRREGGIILAGDARMDSPGHCAQFCTYSFIDVESSAVIHTEFIDCRETNFNSFIMEKVAFERGMTFLTEKIKVKEIVTDQSLSIASVMSKKTYLPNYDYSIYFATVRRYLLCIFCYVL